MAEVGKILACLGFARPLPRQVDSRPPGSAFDAFPTSAKPPGGKSAARPPRRPPVAHPTPDLRKASERENPRPTFAKKRRSGKFLPGKSWPDLLAWGPFGSIFGSRKTYFCREMIFWWGYKGIPPAQMNSMVPGIHMGRLLCPQNPFKKILGKFSKSGQLQVAPVTSLYIPYSPLKGP